MPGEHERQAAAWEAIASKASKVTSFTDLAGHESAFGSLFPFRRSNSTCASSNIRDANLTRVNLAEYLKTTLSGLTGTAADFVLLVVGGNAGIIGLSKEHLSVALALSLPIVVIVTKVDMTPAPVLEQNLKQLVKVLKSPGCRFVPLPFPFLLAHC